MNKIEQERSLVDYYQHFDPKTLNFGCFFSFLSEKESSFVYHKEPDVFVQNGQSRPSLLPCIVNVTKLPSFFEKIGQDSLAEVWRNFLKLFPFKDSDILSSLEFQYFCDYSNISFSGNSQICLAIPMELISASQLIKSKWEKVFKARLKGFDFGKLDEEDLFSFRFPGVDYRRLSPLSFDYGNFFKLVGKEKKFFKTEVVPRGLNISIHSINKIPDFFSSLSCPKLALKWTELVEEFNFIETDSFSIDDLLVVVNIFSSKKIPELQRFFDIIYPGLTRTKRPDLYEKWESRLKERTINPVNKQVSVVRSRVEEMVGVNKHVSVVRSGVQENSNSSDSLKTKILTKLQSFSLTNNNALVIYKRLMKIYNKQKGGEKSLFDALCLLEEQGVEELFFEDFLKNPVESFINTLFTYNFDIQGIVRILQSDLLKIRQHVDFNNLFYRLFKIFKFNSDDVVSFINELDTNYSEGVSAIGFLPELLKLFSDEEIFFIIYQKSEAELLNSIIMAIEDKRNGTFEIKFFDEISRFSQPEYCPTAALDLDYNK